MKNSSNTPVLDALQTSQNVRIGFDTSVTNTPLDERHSSETTPADVYIRQFKECRRLIERFATSSDNDQAQLKATIAKECEVLASMATKARADLDQRLNGVPQKRNMAMSQLKTISDLQCQVASIAKNAGITGFDIPVD